MGHFSKVLFSLLALLSLFNSSFAPANTPPALARLDLDNLQDLSLLAGTPIYAHLFTSQGTPYLLLPANTAQQAGLVNRGFALTILDDDASAAQYAMLFGQPAELAQAAALTPLLLVEGRQALVRATPDLMDTFAGLALRPRLLQLHPLVITPQTQAPARPTTIAPNPLVQEMLDQVDTDLLYKYVGDLSGEWDVIIEGSPYRLDSRYTRTGTPIKKATRYMYEYFQSLGMMVDYHYYTLSGVEKRNVMARQTGIGQPDRIFLITAHLDSYSNDPYYNAPGADDNASGTAAVMQIAKILKEYKFDCTIDYVLFTGEEQGLIGSAAYAEDAYNRGDNIEAVLNLDMVAYNTPNSDRTLEMHTRPGNADDLMIADLFQNVLSAYQINLTSYILPDGESASDHASFWDYDYPAILAIEDWADHTPNYHKTTDLLSTLDMGYYTDFTRASLATLAHMGCLSQGTLAGAVTDASTSLPMNEVTIQATQGAKSRKTASQFDGSYQIALPTGAYTVEARTAGYRPIVITDTLINLNSATTLNFAMQPCQDFQNLIMNYTPVIPLPGQVVTFTASIEGNDPVLQWDFGSGGFEAGLVVTHTFDSAGGYPVQVQVTNGCTPIKDAKFVPVGLITLYLPFTVSAQAPAH